MSASGRGGVLAARCGRRDAHHARHAPPHIPARRGRQPGQRVIRGNAGPGAQKARGRGAQAARGRGAGGGGQGGGGIKSRSGVSNQGRERKYQYKLTREVEAIYYPQPPPRPNTDDRIAGRELTIDGARIFSVLCNMKVLNAE